ALDPELILYQRLLAGDEDEAHEILDKQFRVSPRQQVFDKVIVPVLMLAAHDRARHEISESDHEHLLRTVRALLDGTSESGSRAGVGGGVPATDAEIALAESAIASTPPSRIFRILGVAARNATDELVAEMLDQLFDPTKVAVHAVGSD